MDAKRYSVIIPYYHRFYVTAANEEEAIDKAHSESGDIVGYDDNDAWVEEVDDNNSPKEEEN